MCAEFFSAPSHTLTFSTSSTCNNNGNLLPHFGSGRPFPLRSMERLSHLRLLGRIFECRVVPLRVSYASTTPSFHSSLLSCIAAYTGIRDRCFGGSSPRSRLRNFPASRSRLR